MILGENSINHFRIKALVFALLMSYKMPSTSSTIHNNNKKNPHNNFMCNL